MPICGLALSALFAVNPLSFLRVPPSYTAPSPCLRASVVHARHLDRGGNGSVNHVRVYVNYWNGRGIDERIG